MTQAEILSRLQDRLFLEDSDADHIKEDLIEAIRALEGKRQEGEDVVAAHREVATMMNTWLLRS